MKMDNSSKYIVKSITNGLTSGIMGSVKNNLIQLNRSQKVFHKNIEKFLERKLERLNDNNVNITGNVKDSLIICGDSNYVIPLNFKDYIKYKDDIAFQKKIEKIIPPFFTIDMILKELNNYKKSYNILYLDTARRLWQRKFISQIDSFSKENYEDIPGFDKIRNYLSSKYHRDITKQFIGNDINVEYLLTNIFLIRKSIKYCLSILKNLRRKK